MSADDLEFNPEDLVNRNSPRDPAKIAAHVILAHALAGSGELTGIIVVEPWNSAWTELLEEAWRDLTAAAPYARRELLLRYVGVRLTGHWLLLRRESQASRQTKNDLDEVTEALSKGQSVCGLSSAPERCRRAVWAGPCASRRRTWTCGCAGVGHARRHAHELADHEL